MLHHALTDREWGMAIQCCKLDHRSLPNPLPSVINHIQRMVIRSRDHTAGFAGSRQPGRVPQSGAGLSSFAPRLAARRVSAMRFRSLARNQRPGGFKTCNDT